MISLISVRRLWGNLANALSVNNIKKTSPVPLKDPSTPESLCFELENRPEVLSASNPGVPLNIRLTNTPFKGVFNATKLSEAYNKDIIKKRDYIMLALTKTTFKHVLFIGIPTLIAAVALISEAPEKYSWIGVPIILLTALITMFVLPCVGSKKLNENNKNITPEMLQDIINLYSFYEDCLPKLLRQLTTYEIIILLNGVDDDFDKMIIISNLTALQRLDINKHILLIKKEDQRSIKNMINNPPAKPINPILRIN